MASLLHNKKIQKRVWIVLASIIILSFMLWGSGSVIRSSREARYVGKIGKKIISVSEFRDALLASRNQAIIIWGDEFFKLENQINLEIQAWDRVLLLNQAKQRKIRISDAEVTETIQSYPFFQRDSQFDFDTYQRLLKFLFHTPARIFEEQTRDNLKIRKLYEQITDDIKLTEEEIKEEYKKENEEARIEYIAAIKEDFSQEAQPEDKQVEEYYKNNTLEFKKPETFNLQYISLSYPEGAESDEIETIDNQAKDIFRRLRTSKDISKFTEENSLNLEETGLFELNDPIPGIGWSPQIATIVTKLDIAELASPIHTPKGWYFIKLKEKKAPYVPEFEEVKEEARDKLIELKAKEIAKKNIEAAGEKVRQRFKDNPDLDPNKINLKKLADEFNLKHGETEFFKRASYIPGIGISDRFFDIISSLKEGQITIILEMNQGFYMARLKELKEIEEEKYIEEKEEFSERIIALNKEKSFTEFLQLLRKEANLEINLSQP